MPTLTGLEANLGVRGVTYNNVVYIWNGRNRMRRYDGVTWNYAGIDKYTFTPTVSAGAPSGDGITGTYYYYVVPVNSKATDIYGRAICGIPSTQSFEIIPAAQKVTVGGIPATHPDPQVDKWYIFRNLDGQYYTGANDDENQFYLVGEVAIGATSFADEVTDYAAQQAELLRFNRQIPPTCKSGFQLGQRLITFGFDPYTTGTATKNGTTASLIDFTGASLAEGMKQCWFQAAGSSVKYRIKSVVSATQIELENDFVGTLTDSAYSIWRPGNDAYISEVGDFEAYGPDDEAFRWKLSIPTGDNIIAGCAVGEVGYLFCIDKIYVIYGQGDTIESLKISPTPMYSGLGCVGPDALCVVDNNIYFMSLRGPMRYSGGSDIPAPIGERLNMQATIEELAATQLNKIQCGHNGNEVHFAVPELGQTEPSRVYVYKIQEDVWLERKYIHPNVYAYMQNADGIPKLFFGQGKHLCEDAVNDGVQDFVQGATVRGTVANTSTATSVVVSSGAFYTTDSGLAEAYCHVYYTGGGHRGSGRITSNTSNTVTCSAGFFDDNGDAATPQAGDTFEIGGRWWHKTKTFESPGVYKTDEGLSLGIDGVDSNTELVKTEYINDVEQTSKHTILADKVQEKFSIHAQNGLYAAKVEVRRSGSKVGLRYMLIDEAPAGKELQ